jgi:uncharacterized protein YjbI with pentapeptide repeats
MRPILDSGRVEDWDGERDLTGTTQRRWILKDTRLRAVDLANAEAPYSEWRVVELRGCRLTGFDLRDSTGLHVLFEDCRADLMSLRSARIEGAIFRDCVLTGADFSGADLRGARFERCDLTEVELREARLEGATLDGCRLAGIRGALALRGTRMRWDDVVELAPAFAGALEISLIED